jgi:hypothetical protein
MQAVYSNACMSKTTMTDWYRQFYTHVLNTIRTKLQHLCWDVLDHLACNQDLSPFDFHNSMPLKLAFKGQRFQSDTYVKQDVCNFSEAAFRIFQEGLQHLSDSVGSMSESECRL